MEAGEPRLTQKADAERVLIERPGMKKLQGHGSLEPTVFGSKDDAHASFAEGLEHAVVAKRTAHRPTALRP